MFKVLHGNELASCSLIYLLEDGASILLTSDDVFLEDS